MLSLLELCFGCTHRRTTWPRGKGKQCRVVCISCGSEFAYSWEQMRILEPLPMRVEAKAVLYRAS